jgi:hypothetical protein
VGEKNARRISFGKPGRETWEVLDVSEGIILKWISEK